MSLGGEELSDLVAGAAGGLQAGVYPLLALTHSPLLELDQSLLLIGKPLEGASSGFWQEHPSSESKLGDIHADGSEGLVHPELLLV
jgi:hypothetical protein